MPPDGWQEAICILWLCISLTFIVLLLHGGQFLITIFPFLSYKLELYSTQVKPMQSKVFSFDFPAVFPSLQGPSNIFQWTGADLAFYRKSWTKKFPLCSGVPFKTRFLANALVFEKAHFLNCIKKIQIILDRNLTCKNIFLVFWFLLKLVITHKIKSPKFLWFEKNPKIL